MVSLLAPAYFLTTFGGWEGQGGKGVARAGRGREGERERKRGRE